MGIAHFGGLPDGLTTGDSAAPSGAAGQVVDVGYPNNITIVAPSGTKVSGSWDKATWIELGTLSGTTLRLGRVRYRYLKADQAFTVRVDDWVHPVHHHNVPHHTVVPPHIYAADEMTEVADLTTLGALSNATKTSVIGLISPAESDMLVDGLANNGADSITLTNAEGLLYLFTAPIHLLETLAVIYDEMASTSVTGTGVLSYSKDTTNGVNGTWVEMHGHIQDISVLKLAPDAPIPATVKPFMSNVEGVKAIRVFGPNLLVNLVELRIWIPKVAAPSPPPPPDDDPCDSLPRSNASHASLLLWLEDAGVTIDDPSHYTKEELWVMIEHRCN